MHIYSSLLAPLLLALPLVVLSASEAGAGAASRGTMELTNPTSKGVTCHLVSYAKERVKGEYPRRGAHVTAEPNETGKGNKRFTLAARLGAICYYTEDYTTKPSLDATNGTGAGPVCRTDHFTMRANSIITITPRSNMSNCSISSRAGTAPRGAKPPRRR